MVFGLVLIICSPPEDDEEMIRTFEKNYYSALGHLVMKFSNLCGFPVRVEKGDKRCNVLTVIRNTPKALNFAQ